MSFDTRKKSLLWISPSGKKFDLKLKSPIRYSRKRKGEVKNNPTRSYGEKNERTSYKVVNASDDTFQDMGMSGRDISLTVIFTGENHDTEAMEFEKAYCERGKSKLQLHYGDFLLVQAMDFDRLNDDVKTLSLTEVQVTFHECGKTKYPTTKRSSQSAAKTKAQNARAAVAQSFSNTVATVKNQTTFASKIQSNLDKINNAFDSIQNATFVSILQDLKNGNILNNPYVMSTQLGLLFNAAFGTYTNVSDVLNTVYDLLPNFTSSNDDRDEYIADNVFAQNMIISASENVNGSELDTRKEAIEAAEDLQEINDIYQEASQSKEQEFNKKLDDTIIQDVDISDVVNETIGSLVDKSDDLKIEKTISVSEVTGIVNIAAQYYPDDFKADPDKTIEYLIKTNDFSFDKLIYLNKGDKFVIYV